VKSLSFVMTGPPHAQAAIGAGFYPAGACGGPVMTKLRDFTELDEGYFVEWPENHDSP
jgi:hypothetical protein